MKLNLLFILFIFASFSLIAQSNPTFSLTPKNQQKQPRKEYDSTIIKKMQENSNKLKAEKELTISKQPLAERKFNLNRNYFLKNYWSFHPEWSTVVGFKVFDTLLLIPNEAQRTKTIAFCNEEIKKLNTLIDDSLSDENRIDKKILINELQKEVWYLTVLKDYEWNPSIYNIGEPFSLILSNGDGDLAKRINTFYTRMANIPAYYEAAKKNIKDPANEYVQLAIDQNEGALSIFEHDFIDSLKSLKYTKEQQDFYLKRNTASINAIKDYINFLKNLKNDNPRSFRLGNVLYTDKFKYEIQSEYSVDEIYKAAETRKTYLQDEMYTITTKLWSKYFGTTYEIPKDKLKAIRKLIDTISVQHVAPENFKSEIEKLLPALTSFVNKKNLLKLDPKKPLKVRNEPSYMAGVAGASMSSPGPYEKKGISYYNVGTLDGWSKEKAESYLREYNNYTLQILNIHEAIPGHYVQLVYSNKSPSLIKSIFGNGAMVEGWAVYSELMMMENGFGDVTNSLEFWLMYYKWNLRTVCNTLLDIGVHTKNMSKEDAMDLLTNQAFQQQTEAEGKWKRVQVTNVQLTSYFTGFHEILQLREKYKTQQNNIYSLKAFNEKLLSYGSAPVKYIKELMLKK